jgi:hypothetical protein
MIASTLTPPGVSSNRERQESAAATIELGLATFEQTMVAADAKQRLTAARETLTEKS